MRTNVLHSSFPLHHPGLSAAAATISAVPQKTVTVTNMVSDNENIAATDTSIVHCKVSKLFLFVYGASVADSEE